MWRVLLNTKASCAAAEDLAERIVGLFRDAGVEADVRCVRTRIDLAATKASHENGVTTLVAAGGDGTVSAVAAAASKAGLPMAVLPLGTRNNFARDMGLPLDLEGAVKAAVAGQLRAIDLAQVNGRVFVNNSSVGVYTDVIRERDKHRWRRRIGKMLATIRAAWRVLSHPKSRHFLLASPQRSLSRKVAFVFVGNNDYDPKLITGRGRARIDRGELCLWMPTGEVSRWDFVRFAVRAALGRLRDAEELERALLPELWIDSGRRHVRVSTDGEVTRMRGPLHYRILPGALQVMAP